MKRQPFEHLISAIDPDSIAEEMGIESGDVLLRINDRVVEDIFDYRFLIRNEKLQVLIRKKPSQDFPEGEEWLLEIEKEEEDDLGLQFDNGLMDDYRTCTNQCVFCFIDQMPKGMRDTLYFKDDDTRLSFLQGNYATFTNMSDHDVNRILRYHLSPINVSFHTTNRKLRCEMLHNRFAGEALDKVKRLCGSDSHVELNGQIVLCKGINDGKELSHTLEDLYREYRPALQSVSVVPVGLTKFRENLHKLLPFTKQDAREVLAKIRKWQKKSEIEYGDHFVYAGDEWYLLADEIQEGREENCTGTDRIDRILPKESDYDGYPQLENGVGMLRLLITEFRQALEEQRKKFQAGELVFSSVTGYASYPVIRMLYAELQQSFPGIHPLLYPVRNDFFGERITVTGLLTGQDIVKQLKGKELGKVLFLPENLLRSGEDYLLDDMTTGEISRELQVPVEVAGMSGGELVETILHLARGAGGDVLQTRRTNPYEIAGNRLPRGE